VKSNIKKQTVVKRLLGDFDWLSSTIIRLYPYLAVIYFLILVARTTWVQKRSLKFFLKKKNWSPRISVSFSDQKVAFSLQYFDRFSDSSSLKNLENQKVLRWDWIFKRSWLTKKYL